MATSPVNRKYRVIQDTLDFQVATGTVFNEGDLMYWDTGTSTAKPLANAVGQPDYLLGDAQGTQPVTHTNSANFSNAVSIYVAPHTVKLISKGSGTYAFGTPAYFNTDAQSFTTVSATSATMIGVLQGSARENGVGSGTLVAEREYEIILKRSYALSF